ncbi:MAG: hypothetical protein J5666_04950 [Bacilli bacterium]|nr:hypothetical protein [Bacilli bacterium]
MEKPSIEVTFGEVFLKEANFVRPNALDQTNYQIDVVDIIDVVDVAKDSFRVLYTRKTRTDVPFKFSVTFDFVTYLGREGTDYYQGDIERIKKFAEARKVEIINNMSLASRASLLIGNIIKEVGNPFITQPAVITPSNK